MTYKTLPTRLTRERIAKGEEKPPRKRQPSQPKQPKRLPRKKRTKKSLSRKSGKRVKRKRKKSASNFFGVSLTMP